MLDSLAMTSNLVIVESPAKAKTIERYLGPGYTVLASYGHVRDLPENPDEATKALAAHPDRKDVRLLVAVLRDGESTCLLRQRDHDTDDKVASGPDIAPGLVQALSATLQD